MLGAAPFCVSEVLENKEIFIALPNIFQKQIKDRRLRCLDAAVLDAVAGTDVAHLKSGLKARIMARRQAGESEGARRQRHRITVGKSCPAIGGIEIVGQPGQDIVAKFGFYAVTFAGSLGLEGSLVADED